ncbi:MAG: hypothetical protein DMF86_05500 [Acidobacteria bacterium]|nr:MAG: hypothetical protein DMF86_05500 [Acidobacteriota bacterium]
MSLAVSVKKLTHPSSQTGRERPSRVRRGSGDGTTRCKRTIPARDRPLRADVRPFLGNVLRGRRVAPERVEAVAHHYERFGGVSPLTDLTIAQARALEAALVARDVPLPVRVGMRNWHPFLKDTMAEMTRAGLRRAIGFLAAAQRSYSGCLQYRENVDEARALLHAEGTAPVEVTYVGDWHERPGFIDAVAANTREALDRLPHELRDAARIVFTAHSIPLSMAERYPYREQLDASARLAPAIRGWSRTFAITCAPSARADCAPWCSARWVSSAITSKSCTTSTSRRSTPRARSDCRRSAPPPSTRIPASSRRWRTPSSMSGIVTGADGR